MLPCVTLSPLVQAFLWTGMPLPLILEALFPAMNVEQKPATWCQKKRSPPLKIMIRKPEIGKWWKKESKEIVTFDTGGGKKTSWAAVMSALMSRFPNVTFIFLNVMTMRMIMIKITIPLIYRMSMSTFLFPNMMMILIMMMILMRLKIKKMMMTYCHRHIQFQFLQSLGAPLLEVLSSVAAPQVATSVSWHYHLFWNWLYNVTGN